MTERQVTALLAATDGPSLVDQRDRTLLMLGLLAGLRTGELHRLRWRDIDLFGSTITLIGKGTRPQRLPAAPQLGDQLARWKQTLEQGMPIDGGYPVLPASVRHAAEPRPLGGEAIRRAVHARGAAIGVPNLRPHDLRRTFAATLDDRGVPLQDVSFLLRHLTLDATRVYLRPNPSRSWAHLERLVIPDQDHQAQTKAHRQDLSGL